ncbi:hypothetical protein OsJ_36338 [Oryza sativa Japonica Group]|uniref:Uncharacterized protein n=4 Tax=Oryza TaxID=4527 RepID=A0A8J8XVQ7_ORYSJ|nr:hypothetical protein LOC_Os12g34560 [Oryza sativa Japonica Group]EAZ20717.1 hypothetical protein OsJ_36338 [Oryza sativa Japonica Group]
MAVLDREPVRGAKSSREPGRVVSDQQRWKALDESLDFLKLVDLLKNSDGLAPELQSLTTSIAMSSSSSLLFFLVPLVLNKIY